jgi:hypothetical protein
MERKSFAPNAIREPLRRMHPELSGNWMTVKAANPTERWRVGWEATMPNPEAGSSSAPV